MQMRFQPPAHRRTWLRPRVLLAGAAVVVLGLAALETARVVAGRNLHTVVPGQIYRCAQLSGDDFTNVIEANGIRTVINLRGSCPTGEWYRNECRALAQLGVARHDVNFSAVNLPPVAELRELVEALEQCEYPVLLHCRRGADRTGLAAGVALLLRSDATVAEAREQLSWRYGHLPLFRRCDLDSVYDLYERWLAKRGTSHRRELFAHWAKHEYRPLHCWAELTPLEMPERLTLGKPAAARFRVTNRSEFPWHLKRSENSGVHLRYLLRTPDRKHAFFGGVGFLDQVVPPGGSIELTLSLPAVRVPGRYQLLIDMQDEERGWFSIYGSKPYETELDVTDE